LEEFDDLSEFFFFPPKDEVKTEFTSDSNTSQSTSQLECYDATCMRIDSAGAWEQYRGGHVLSEFQMRNFLSGNTFANSCNSNSRLRDMDQEEQTVYSEEDIQSLHQKVDSNEIDVLKVSSSTLKCGREDDDHPYPCRYCFKSFNKKWRLSCHMEQVHTKTRNFACTECDKKFRSDYDLQRHSTTHTGQRFVCYQCDTGFASKQRVACHIRRSLACWDRMS
ncbi:hypothetical protein PFISCL1PPCAC_15571, partial [Pristionchus fissidentatus]